MTIATQFLVGATFVGVVVVACGTSARAQTSRDGEGPGTEVTGLLTGWGVHKTQGKFSGADMVQSAGASRGSETGSAGKICRNPV